MHMNESDRAAWNRFVAAAPAGDVLQCWEWGQLKARTGWEPLYFSVRRPEGIRAVALVLKRPIPHTGRCLFYCPRGPIVTPGDTDSFTELVADIRAEARRRGAIALQIDPAIKPSDGWYISCMRDLSFRDPGPMGDGFGGVQPRAVMKVDLSASLDEVMARFHSKWRYNIRYAAKHGVTVQADCPFDDLDPFYDLLAVTAERDGFGIRSRSYFHVMWQYLVEPGLASLFMARVEGRPVAGAIAFVLGEQAWYVYGASSNEHRNLMPNHLMQWEMMRWAKEHGCQVYDMRGVSPEVDGEPVVEHLAGLNRFKRGFAAEYVEYVGDWSLVFSPLWHALFERAVPVAKRMLKRSQKQSAD